MRSQVLALIYLMVSANVAFAGDIADVDELPDLIGAGSPAPQATQQAVPVQRRVIQDAQAQFPAAPLASGDKTAKNKAIDASRADSATKPKGDVYTGALSVEDIINYGKDFDTIAVINKAACRNVRNGQFPCQSMTVYRYKNGVPIGGASTFKISTGKEKWICDEKKDPTTGATTGYEARWTGTPTGFFNPYYLDPDHKSKQYDDASMNYAVFFNKLGIASHEGELPVDRNGVPINASHGCVRMPTDKAKQMFKWTLESGGPVDPNDPAWSGQCPGPKGTTIACSSVVGEVQQEGTYDSVQQIPDITQDGQRTGNYKPGFKTLYVVECLKTDGSSCASSASKIQELKTTQLIGTPCDTTGLQLISPQAVKAIQSGTGGLY